MTEATTSPKQILAELIDAYASAKATGNEMLLKMSVSHLNEFLNGHEVISANPAEAEAE